MCIQNGNLTYPFLLTFLYVSVHLTFEEALYCYVIGLLVVSKSKLCAVMRGEEQFRAGVLGIRCHPILLFDFV
jgi:hypothetical protein